MRYLNIFSNNYRLVDGFSSGTGLKLIKNLGLPTFLPLICYEALFSNEILEQVKEARWIINITNDANTQDSRSLAALSLPVTPMYSHNRSDGSTASS